MKLIFASKPILLSIFQIEEEKKESNLKNIENNRNGILS